MILLGGYDIFEHLKDEDTPKADLFNRGYPAILDLAKLKCPCGKEFLKGTASAICAACGTATCSPECHDKYCQSVHKCVFANNFTLTDVQGLRSIRLENIAKMQDLGVKPYTQCSPQSAKFMFATTGPSKNTVYLQKGFRIYGSPLVFFRIIF